MGYRRNYYSGDPRWITTKYRGTCTRCGGEVSQGSQAYYYPTCKSIYCERCGEQASAEFNCAAQAEDMYCRQYESSYERW